MKSIQLLSLFFVFLCGCNQGPPDKKVYIELDRIGEKLSQKYELNYLHSSIGKLVASQKCKWAMSVTSNKKMTLEEGEKFAASLIGAYLYEVLQKNNPFESYLEKHEKNQLLEPAFFGFRLAFWDDDVERPLKPYLAQIRFAEEKVYFYYANEKTKALEEPIVKTMGDLSYDKN